LRPRQIGKSLDIDGLPHGVVGIIDALVGHACARLLHSGDAVERIESIGICASR
jgi:hypothetical protein